MVSKPNRSPLPSEPNEDEVPLVSIAVDSQDDSLVVLIVKGLKEQDQGKVNGLLNALEAVEGVLHVEAQTAMNRINVSGSAPGGELVQVCTDHGMEAECRVEPKLPPAVEKEATEDEKLFLVRAAALVCLIVQNCAQALCMKYSNDPSVRTPDGLKYLATTAVVSGEAAKILSSLVIIAYNTGGPLGVVSEINTEMVQKPVECLKLLIPSMLYTVQNNLQFIAIQNLSPAVFQVTSQLKILSTAVFTVLLLGRVLGAHRWAALCVLTLGCIFVNLDSISPTSSNKDGGNQVLGVMCCLCMACTSGLAGVYFEKMLKGAKTSLWIRQIQLGVGGIAIGTFGAFSKDGNVIKEHGFFQGYTGFVWFLVCLNSLGGLLVAVVVKYTDNIAKAFAVSISIILSAIISIPLFGNSISGLFFIGTSLVIGSVFLYEAIVPFNVKVNLVLVSLVLTALYLAPPLG